MSPLYFVVDYVVSLGIWLLAAHVMAACSTSPRASLGVGVITVACGISVAVALITQWTANTAVGLAVLAVAYAWRRAARRAEQREEALDALAGRR